MPDKEIKNLNSYLSHLKVDFLEYCEIEKNLAVSTLKMYDFYLSKFIEWLNENQIIISVPLDINEDIIRKYRVYLNRKIGKTSGQLLMKRSQKTHLVTLRAFLKYLGAVKDFDVVPPDKIILGKAEATEPKFLNESQLMDILTGPDITTEIGLRDRAIMEILFSTGLRVSELTSLNRDQINIETSEFSVIGKGRKVRVVYMTDRSKDWLIKSLDTRGDKFTPLFIRYSGAKPDMESFENDGENLRLTARSVQRMIKKYSLMAGISVDVTPHVFRHSMATTLLRNGADLRSVQELLGHSNVSTTQIYTHVTNKQLKETHEKFMGG
ncbi:MAG: tyrosine-type recombinase/integrase [bacterium]|nr:tyrosine-type recombinase/integrase [bacterium]